MFAQNKAANEQQLRNEESSVIEAVKYFNQGEYEKAETLFHELLSRYPSNDAAYYYLAMCRAYAKDADKSEEYFRKAYELDPDNYWYRYRLAFVYAATGRLEVTAEMYEKLLEDFPKKSELYYNLVDVYLRLGNYDRALATLDSLEQIMGKSESTVMMRYELLLNLKRPEEALASLQSYNEEYSSPYVLSTLADYEMSLYNDSTALAYYNEALDLMPSYAPALLGRAELYRMTSRFSSFFPAITSFMADTEQYPSYKGNYLNAFMRNIDPKFIMANRSSVDGMYSAALNAHPADTSIIKCNALYYYMTERPDSTDACYRKVCELYPDDRDAFGLYLTFLYYIKDFDKVLSMCLDNYNQNPNGNNSMAEYALYAAVNLGDDEQIIGLCDKLLANKSLAKEIQLMVLSCRGDVYHRMGDEKLCYKSYDAALKLDPGYVPVLNNYAYFLSLSGKKLKKAYEMSRKTIDAEPDNATYLDTFGWILYLRGNYQEAKGIFKHAMLYGAKESAVMLDHYADVLFALGEYDLAFIYWNQAKKKVTVHDEEGFLQKLKEKIAAKEAEVKKAR